MNSPSRRDFFRTTGVAASSILLPRQVMASLANIKNPIKPRLSSSRRIEQDDF
jgi:hypothetical protein